MTIGTSMALVAALALAHPLPEGAIDRGSQTIVSNDKVEVIYWVGMSPKTLEVDLRQMLPQGEIVPADENAQLERYRQLLGDRLLDRMQLSIDGEATPLACVEALIAPKDHFILELHFEAALPKVDEEIEVQFRDLNYFGIAGYQRTALRPNGDMEVTETEAEAAIVRVEKVEWEKLTPRQQQQAGTVTGRFKLEE
jgi:hypothetical protein